MNAQSTSAETKPDIAFEQLGIAAKLPGLLSYGERRLHQYRDRSRGDPRLEQIVFLLVPK